MPAKRYRYRYPNHLTHAEARAAIREASALLGGQEVPDLSRNDWFTLSSGALDSKLPLAYLPWAPQRAPD